MLAGSDDERVFGISFSLRLGNEPVKRLRKNYRWGSKRPSRRWRSIDANISYPCSIEFRLCGFCFPGACPWFEAMPLKPPAVDRNSGPESSEIRLAVTI